MDDSNKNKLEKDKGCSGSEDDFGFRKVDKSSCSNSNNTGREMGGACAATGISHAAEDSKADEARRMSSPVLGNTDKRKELCHLLIDNEKTCDSMDKKMSEASIEITQNEVSDTDSTDNIRSGPENRQKINLATACDEGATPLSQSNFSSQLQKINIDAHSFICSAIRNPPPGYENYHPQNNCDNPPCTLQSNTHSYTNQSLQPSQNLQVTQTVASLPQSVQPPSQSVQLPPQCEQPPLQTVQQPATQVQPKMGISAQQMNDVLRKLNLLPQQSPVTQLRNTHQSMHSNQARSKHHQSPANDPTQQAGFSGTQLNYTSGYDNHHCNFNGPAQYTRNSNQQVNYAVPIQGNRRTPITQPMQARQMNMQVNQPIQVSRRNYQRVNETMLAYTDSHSSNRYNLPILAAVPICNSDGECSNIFYEMMPNATGLPSPASAAPPAVHASASTSGASLPAVTQASLAPTAFLDSSPSLIEANQPTLYGAAFPADLRTPQEDRFDIMRRRSTRNVSGYTNINVPGRPVNVNQRPVGSSRAMTGHLLHTYTSRNRVARMYGLQNADDAVPRGEMESSFTPAEEVSEPLDSSLDEAGVYVDEPTDENSTGPEEAVDLQQEIEENKVNRQQETVGASPTVKSTHEEESALAKYEALNRVILALLECPVCMEPISPPIEQCKRGHLVCTNCRQRLGQCPTCRASFASVRNLAMEQVAEKLQYPCRYTALGCRTIISLSVRGLHEASCAYRFYYCPLPQCSRFESMRYDTIWSHHQTHHPDIVLHGEEHTFEVNMRSDKVMDWVMRAHGEIFYIHFVMEVSWGLYGCVTYCGPLDYASNFVYMVQIRDIPNHRMISFSRYTHNDLESRTFTFHRGDAFFAHIYNIYHFTKRDAIDFKNFTVTVSVYPNPDKPVRLLSDCSDNVQ